VAKDYPAMENRSQPDMGNGRGKIDCVYCVHFAGSDQHESASCRFHGAALPASELNRICCHFQASALLSQEGGARTLFAPVARQFGWFGADLEPGVLYEFMYNDPPSIKKLAVLREPNYDTWGWKPPNAG
jgi:hypothetical protein